MKHGLINDMPGWAKGKNQPVWHRRIYRMWISMWERCYCENGKIDWFGCLIHPDFKYLSKFVKWIECQERFEEFKETCEKTKWNIDKDIKQLGNKNYYPEFISLVTVSENVRERNLRYDYSKNQKMVIGISIEDRTVIILKSIKDGKEKGFNPCNITNCLKGRYKHHKKYKWKYLNCKHNKKLRKI